MPKTKNDSLIPNSQIEEMFLRVANDEEVRRYMNLINSNFIALATSYASSKITRVFFQLVDDYERSGKSLSSLSPKKRGEA